MVVLRGGFVCENMCKRNLRDSNPRALAVWYGALLTAVATEMCSRTDGARLAANPDPTGMKNALHSVLQSQNV